MNQLSNQQIEEALRNSECLISSFEVSSAYERLAASVNLHYAGQNPIVMVVMNGGLIPAGQLLTQFTFYHRMYYLHATRYRNNQGTNELEWKFKPEIDLAGEDILLIDDIFDEGITLKRWWTSWQKKIQNLSAPVCYSINSMTEKCKSLKSILWV